jgi:probable HAF family extracellular repeat protein
VPGAGYTIIDLGRLGGRNAESSGLNDQGVVVGYSETNSGSSYAFRDSQGKMKAIGSLLGGDSVATGINNRGQIVGISWNRTSSRSVAFVYSGGRTRAIGKVPSGLSSHMSPRFSLNNQAQVIGFSNRAGNAQVLSGGRLKNLGSLKRLGSVALGINDHGAIVGYSNVAPSRGYFDQGTPHAFLYQRGRMKDLGTLGGSSAAATAINNRGDVVGWSSTTSGVTQDVFLYHNGRMFDLGNLGGPGAAPTAVNDKGQVVGWSDVNGATQRDQFVYSNGTMTDLSKLVSASSGITLQSVVGINNRGQIAGYGTRPDGTTVALLLNPVTTG